MDVSKTIEEFSRFFNEILGYFLPGFVFNLMIYFTVDKEYIPLLKEEFLLNPWVIVLLSYIMGYCVYGIALVRDEILKRIYSWKLIANTIVFIKKRFNKEASSKELLPNILVETIIKSNSKSKEYTSVIQVLEKKEFVDIKDWHFKNIRNLIMSYIPEADQKIYTFMFRSELGNHIGFVFFSFGIWLIVSKISLTFFNNCLLIKSSLLNYYYIAILILVISYFFHITRKRFLDISYKVPFSIFLSKFKPIS